MTKFSRPDSPSMVRGRLATSRAMPPNASAPTPHTIASVASEPCTATENASQANPISTTDSSARKKKRTIIDISPTLIFYRSI